MANHKEKEWEWEGEKYLVQPGQFVTSLKSIAHKAGNGISIKNVRTALEKFEKYEFLASKSTNKNRLVTIVNWELYQSEEDEPASKVASNRQATGKQPATNKNDKNDKDILPLKKESKVKISFTDDDKEYLLAKYLSKQISKRLDRPLQEEKVLQNWSADFEKMVRLDKIDIEDIKNVLVFSQQDDFWQTNILSASKFRKQYLMLLGKMKKEDG